MKKFNKRSWRYIVTVLVFIEICIDFFLKQNLSHWDIIRVAFIILNGVIIAYLLYLSNKAEKLNAQSN
jgi:cytochrome c oxidase subunit IV